MAKDKRTCFKSLLGITFYGLMLFSTVNGNANPQEGQVIAGDVNISSSPQLTTITQHTDKAIIHWKDFSIGKGEITEFIQPCSQSAVLNRVTGFNPSMIEGMLKANGQVLLVNPQGVIVTKDGSISTKGFLATTLFVNTKDFLSGNNLLLRGDSDAKIQNLGMIASDQGDVFLIAREVENKGTILAKDTVALLGGKEVLLVQEGQKAHVKMPTLGIVCNEGLIKAAQVELKAAGGNIFSYAVSHTGVIEARGFENREGRIFLKGESNKTIIDGKLTALNTDETGGTIHILGEEIRLLEKTHIDICGKFGGGTLLTGGDYQGANPEIPNAKYLFVSPGAEIYANAIDAGNGGKTIFWADKGIAFGGKVEAKGKGDVYTGGFVEISSKGHWAYKGQVDTRCLDGGKTGTLLFDPSDMVISTAPTSNVVSGPGGYLPFDANPGYVNTLDLQTLLDSSNVLVATSPSAGTGGNISVIADISSLSGNSLTLTADKNIDITGVTISLVGDFIMTGEEISITSSAISTAGNATFSIGQTGAGTFTLDGSVSFAGAFNVNGGSGDDSFTLPSGQEVTLLDGSGGSNTLNISGASKHWVLSTVVDGTVTGTHVVNFANIHHLIGSGLDDLTGPNQSPAVTTWNISGPTSGTLDATTYSGMNQLNGNPIGGDDSFVFGGAYSIAGGINGGGGKNSVTAPAAVLQNNWTIDKDNGGVLNIFFEQQTELTNIQSWIGSGGANNYFTFTGPFFIYDNDTDYGIIGGTGLNTLSGPDSATDWFVKEANGGTINPNGATHPTKFKNIQGFQGGDDFNEFTFDGSYEIDQGITGGTGNNRVIGPNVANIWTIIGDNAGELSFGSTTIPLSSIQSWTGGSSDDTFVFYAPAMSSTAHEVSGGLHGGTGGTNTIQGSSAQVVRWTLSGDQQGEIYMYDVGVGPKYAPFSAITHLEGQSTDDAIIGPNVSNTWSIDSNDGGTVASTAFTGMESLQGGTQDDTFTFLDGIGITTQVDGGSGGTNTLNYAAYSTQVNVNIASKSATNLKGGASGGWNRIDTFIGGSHLQNTLRGPTGTTWIISGTDSGTVTGIAGTSTFTAFSNIFGASSGTDIFVLGPLGSLTGTTGIDGNGSTATIQSPIGTNTWTLIDNVINIKGSVLTAAGTTNFIRVQTLDGTAFGNTDILNGPDLYNTWTITENGGGTIQTGILGTTNFLGMGKIMGSLSLDDTFILSTASAALSGTVGIDGNGSLTGNLLASPYIPANFAIINTNNAGVITPLGGTGTTYQNVQLLEGSGTNLDVLDYSGSSVSPLTVDFTLYKATYVDGEASGSFSNIFEVILGSSAVVNLTGNLTYFSELFLSSGDHLWTIDGNTSGNVVIAAIPQTINFANFSDLKGGSGIDTFVLTGAGAVDSIDGGEGNSNALQGKEQDNTWHITGMNAGNVSGVSSFSNIQNVTGASTHDDTFIFTTDASHLTGTTGIDGNGSFLGNTLSSPYIAANFAIINTNNAGVITPLGGTGTTYQNIQVLEGSGTNLDVLDYSGSSVSPLTVDFTLHKATYVDGEAAGAFSNIYGVILGNSAVVNLTGNLTYFSELSLSSGDHLWTIDGNYSGNVVNAAIPQTINFANFADLKGGLGTDAFILVGAGSTSSIDGGNGHNSLQGKDQNNSWHITGMNAGNVPGINSFIHIENLTGGALADTFVLADQKGVLGIIDGGSNSGNILDYSEYTTPVSIDYINKTATNIGGFNRIQDFIYPTTQVNKEESLLITYMMTTLLYDQYAHVGNFTKMLEMMSRTFAPFEGFYWNTEDKKIKNLQE